MHALLLLPSPFGLSLPKSCAESDQVTSASAVQPWRRGARLTNLLLRKNKVGEKKAINFHLRFLGLTPKFTKLMARPWVGTRSRGAKLLSDANNLPAVLSSAGISSKKLRSKKHDA